MTAHLSAFVEQSQAQPIREPVDVAVLSEKPFLNQSSAGFSWDLWLEFAHFCWSKEATDDRIEKQKLGRMLPT